MKSIQQVVLKIHLFQSVCRTLHTDGLKWQTIFIVYVVSNKHGASQYIRQVYVTEDEV